MNRWLTSSTIALAGCGIVHAQSTQPATPFNLAAATQAAAIPITSIKLFSSGVGYFERSGTVNGDDQTRLTFKSAQINDILKSLVLQDLNGGTLGTITYPSQDPISRTLAGFSIDITANPSLLDLLTQLRGSSLTINYGPDKLNGILLGTETKQRPMPNGKEGTIAIPILNLLIGTQIRALPLDDVRDVELDDPQLQKDLAAALLTLAGARNQDQKPVDIEFHGVGQRHVRIGYVVESPVWKTSYRLVLHGDKPNLQGWAMVENQTDSDWSDVQLSLVSGRPISFIENLYSPIYLPRPTVQPNLYGGLQPPTADGGAIAAPQQRELAYSKLANRSIGGGVQVMQSIDSPLNGDSPAANTQQFDSVSSIISAASGVSLGELFSYTIEHVTLPRHESAMLPVVTDAIDATRLSVFNQQTSVTHPLYGVRLKNSTDKHLLQGPVTVFDHGSYAGDAQLDNLPPGQSRLLTYGIDLEMTVNASQESNDVQVQSATISKGVMTIDRRTQASHEFKIDNKSTEAKTLVLEEPVRGSAWQIVDTPKALETTSSVNRFQLDVPAGTSTTFTVKQQVLTGERLEILPSDVPTLTEYISTGAIAKSVRDALAKAVELKTEVVTTQQQMEARQASLKSIETEQNRMRQNMNAVDHQSDYYTRLMKKLNDQETQIETLQSEVTSLQGKLAGASKALSDYVTTLQVE